MNVERSGVRFFKNFWFVWLSWETRFSIRSQTMMIYKVFIMKRRFDCAITLNRCTVSICTYRGREVFYIYQIDWNVLCAMVIGFHWLEFPYSPQIIIISWQISIERNLCAGCKMNKLFKCFIYYEFYRFFLLVILCLMNQNGTVTINRSDAFHQCDSDFVIDIWVSF